MGTPIDAIVMKVYVEEAIELRDKAIAAAVKRNRAFAEFKEACRHHNEDLCSHPIDDCYGMDYHHGKCPLINQELYKAHG